MYLATFLQNFKFLALKISYLESPNQKLNFDNETHPASWQNDIQTLSPTMLHYLLSTMQVHQSSSNPSAGYL